MSVKATNGPVQCIAAKAIIRQGDKVLVLKQSADADVDGANRYHPPGGIIEPGEHIHEALAREVREETGLEVEIGEIISLEEWRVNIREEDCQFFGAFFSCNLKTRNTIQVQETEASGYAWVSLNDLAKVDILEPSLSVIRKVLS